MIEVNQVTKRFGEFVAVHDLSFSIQSGEVLGLLGENGAGKTTTMRIMATVIAPTSGDIAVEGFSVRSQPMEVRKRIGLLFGGDVGLYGRLTARENIRYFGHLYGMDERTLEQRVDHLSQALQMGEYIDRRVNGFSRGMKQKVAIARSLVHDPQVILLDEPTTGLDVSAASVFRNLIADLRQTGKTILFSSHNMGEVEKLCDRVVIMQRGRLRFTGTVSELKQDYHNDDLDEIFMQVVGGERR
ncbi:ATP-binding cassette domain-containing protein [Brevibacillus humidisoli]|uniref:ABC transporter ATP-binding protein n=1 Tax=Brevibacillus humidisoli TaxID=2895522 RepID=UPI001E4D7A8E|nr:ATP-binding cassette domain-containing protein [Brevibacillus humidisoli]UFJ41065.1 ATP-binding cassette domain-containing protein [Brevibacillus humidisoli]